MLEFTISRAVQLAITITHSLTVSVTFVERTPDVRTLSHTQPSCINDDHQKSRISLVSIVYVRFVMAVSPDLQCIATFQLHLELIQNWNQIF